MFKSKKNGRISSTSQSALLPVQNVYSAYNRLPSPVLTIDHQDGNQSQPQYHSYQPQHHQQQQYCKESIMSDKSAPVEKFSQQQLLIREAEERAAAKLKRKSSYSRVLCCFCFPCLPMWARTICCFLFLGICGFAGIAVFFVLSFKRPQIVFNGSNVISQMNNSLAFEYSIYNGNFFEIDFERVKAVIYYPTPNKTSVGVGEIMESVVLHPHTLSNITLPIRLINGGHDEATNITHQSLTVFRSIVGELCPEGDNNDKDVEVTFDLMPTFRFGSYGSMTVAFTEQKAKMSCEKLQKISDK